jgi:hypothetical protein
LFPHIDLNHSQPIEFLDKELARLHGDSEIGQKRVDKLIGVRLIGIQQMKLLYIHVEIQGYNDDEFNKRNFIYFYRLFDMYGENITSLVIFTDANPNYRPAIYELKFMGIELTYKYPIYKIMDDDPVKLAASDNLFDAALLTAYWAIQKKRGALTEEGFADLRFNLIRQLLGKEVDKIRIYKLIDFIKRFVRFEKPEIGAIFEKKFDELLKYEKNMGIQEILLRQAAEEVQEAKSNLYQAQQKTHQTAQRAAQQAARIERKNTVTNMRKSKFSAKRIADILGFPIEEVNAFFKEIDDEI